jgi:hypothetical protein
MALLNDISSLITTETYKYIGDMPDTPNNLICLFLTGGYDPEMDLSKNAITRPTLQVRVRDTSYSSGVARCEAIQTLLRGVTNTEINGNYYIEILQQSDILSLGKDDKNRSNFTINFKIRRST